jgi:hypothetical protein
VTNAPSTGAAGLSIASFKPLLRGLKNAGATGFKESPHHQPTLFSFESHRDCRQLEKVVRDHIQPRDILQEMWTSEIVEAEWEIARLRRFKGQFVTLAKSTALRNLLQLACADADDDEIDDFAQRWFTNKTIKKQVNRILRSIDLDESAVEVEAYRLSMHHLKDIDCRLMELAKRRDELFRQIEDFRAGLSAPAGSGPRQRFDQEIGLEHGGDALMATERQIAANRQNAGRSTGPKSSAGKRRSSGNSLRHGLSCSMGAKGSAQVEALVHRIVGDHADEERLELARDAVRAHFDLLRIREVKRDLMERMYALGTVRPLRRFRSISAEINYVMSQPLDRPLLWPPPINPLGPMPSGEDERAADTMRRLLPEFRKLHRYERRAFNAKQSALRKLADCHRFLSPWAFETARVQTQA